jgi:hypothetical protein
MPVNVHVHAPDVPFTVNAETETEGFAAEVQVEALRDALGGGDGGDGGGGDGGDGGDEHHKPEAAPIAAKSVVNTTEECAICFDDLKSATLLALPCGHVFHQRCASDWLSRHPFCPHCRMNVLSQQIDDEDDVFVRNAPRADAAVDAAAAAAGVALESDAEAAEADGVVPHCRVCAQRIEAMDVHQIVLECRHCFHHECIGAALMRSPLCPWCRARVSAPVLVHINDRRQILQCDPIQDAARLRGNVVRTQAYQVRLHTARFERAKRRGCAVLLVFLMLGDGNCLLVVDVLKVKLPSLSRFAVVCCA